MQVAHWLGAINLFFFCQKQYFTIKNNIHTFLLPCNTICVKYIVSGKFKLFIWCENCPYSMSTCLTWQKRLRRDRPQLYHWVTATNRSWGTLDSRGNRCWRSFRKKNKVKLWWYWDSWGAVEIWCEWVQQFLSGQQSPDPLSYLFLITKFL